MALISRMFVHCAAAAALAALCASARAQQSPADEFESRMAPQRRTEFFLPSTGGVRVFDAGRRESPDVRADDTTKLRAEIQRQGEEERRLNNTYSNPDIVRPQPKTLNCNGSMCTER